VPPRQIYALSTFFLHSEASWNSLQKEKNPSTLIDASKLQQPDEKISKINITHCTPPYACHCGSKLLPGLLLLDEVCRSCG
jgi:hypothetical protein